MVSEANAAMLYAARRCWTLLFTPLGLAVAALSDIAALAACCEDRLVLFVLTLPVLAVWVMVRWCVYAVERSKRPFPGEFRLQWSLKHLLISLTYFAVFVGTVFHHWPFRVRFLIHQSALDQLADELERGREIAVPIEIGSFVIEKAELKDFGDKSMPCLWTDLHPSGYSGFIRCTSEESRRAALIYRGLTEQVSERWLFIVED